MERILADAVTKELDKLRYGEVLYEGEVFTLIEPLLYEYNLWNVNLKDLLDETYKAVYGR